MGKLLKFQLMVAEQDYEFTENSPNIYSLGTLNASNAVKPGPLPPAMNHIVERYLREPAHIVSLKYQLFVFI